MSTHRDLPLVSKRGSPRDGSQTQPEGTGPDSDNDRQFRKVMDDLQSTNESTMKLFTNLLRNDRLHHLKVLDRWLASFVSSDIPSSPIKPLDKSKLYHTQLGRIESLAFIIQGFVKTEHLSQSIWILVERWSSVTKWITYIITQPVDPTPVLSAIMDIMEPILNLEVSEAQAEFMTLPQTIDLIRLLLLGCDKRRDLYRRVSSEDSPSLFRFIRNVCKWITKEPITTAFSASLLSLPPKRIAQGYLVHARAINARHASGSIDPAVAAMTFRSLTDCFCKLAASQPGIWDKFISSTFLQDYINAILTLNNDILQSKSMPLPVPFWPYLHNCCADLITSVIEYSPNPTRYLALIIKSGIIPLVLTAISLLPAGCGYTHTTANAPLRFMLPYLYTSSVAKALVESEGVSLLNAATTIDNNAGFLDERICTQLKNSVDHFPAVYLDQYGQEFQTEACSNEKHWETTRSLPNSSRSKPKCCSTCRVVMYCSEACQREDWSSFHARECRHLYRWYLDLTAQQKTALSLKTRHDQLRYIEYLVNADLPVPTSNHEAPLIRSESGILVCRLDPSEPSSPTDPAIDVFDFASRPGDIMVRTPRTPLSGYRECYGIEQDDNEVNPRLAMLESDSLLEHPQSVILAQGIFPFGNDKRSVHLLAKLKRFPGDESGEKYKIVSHVLGIA
ncbi:hypothetical protein D9611_011894 [Ephemerocybe angulata]|uniref:MYND-type domain-containing protein n=1 Tax=Ephemerocybe angulata TaxID=980116 RepID=A0A8H5BYI8_9AGAR|nr:hypothetical protein D9611_011894 [Tulosesus angulatus]